MHQCHSLTKLFDKISIHDFSDIEVYAPTQPSCVPYSWPPFEWYKAQIGQCYKWPKPPSSKHHIDKIISNIKSDLLQTTAMTQSHENDEGNSVGCRAKCLVEQELGDSVRFRQLICCSA